VEPRRSETSAVESRYRATASEGVTVDTSLCVCVIVNYTVKSRAVSKSQMNLVINPKLVYNYVII
jgi:hypothetical protein